MRKSIKTGWYKGKYFGDLPKGEGGKCLGVSTNDEREAKAVFSYLSAKRRNPTLKVRMVKGRRRYIVR